MSKELCIYQPGKHNIIDLLLHDGGTGENQAALENARQRYPGAEIMPFDDWRAEKAKQQDEPVTWTEIDEERYWEMLECLPPAAMSGRAFLVGEPWDHHTLTGKPRFTACIMYGTSRIVERPEGGIVCTLHQEAAPGSRFFQSDRPVTVAEFKAGLPRPDLDKPTNCNCNREVPVGQPMPNYCPEHDGDYSRWLVSNNID